MGRTQINIKVSPDQKREWEDAAENHPEVESLSHLIRLSVTREIKDAAQDQQQASQDAGGDVAASVAADVDESLMRIERKIKAVSEGVDDIKAEFTEPDDYFEIVGAINRVLPSKDPDESVTADDTRFTSDDLMLKTGASRETVQDALLELKGSGAIWEAEDPEREGERVYFHYP